MILRSLDFESSASAIPPLRLTCYAPIICGKCSPLSRAGCVQVETAGAIGDLHPNIGGREIAVAPPPQKPLSSGGRAGQTRMFPAVTSGGDSGHAIVVSRRSPGNNNVGVRGRNPGIGHVGGVLVGDCEEVSRFPLAGVSDLGVGIDPGNGGRGPPVYAKPFDGGAIGGRGDGGRPTGRAKPRAPAAAGQSVPWGICPWSRAACPWLPRNSAISRSGCGNWARRIICWNPGEVTNNSSVSTARWPWPEMPTIRIGSRRSTPTRYRRCGRCCGG